jgi:hypothetical protein
MVDTDARCLDAETGRDNEEGDVGVDIEVDGDGDMANTSRASRASSSSSALLTRRRCERIGAL